MAGCLTPVKFQWADKGKCDRVNLNDFCWLVHRGDAMKIRERSRYSEINWRQCNQLMQSLNITLPDAIWNLN